MNEKKITICLLGSAKSIHLLKWSRYFADRGHNTHLVSYAQLAEGYDLNSIKLHLIKKRFPIEMWPFNTLLNLPFILTKVKKIIKEIKPDIINSHYVTSYGTLAALLKFRPLVITAWGSDVLVTPKKFWPSKFSVSYALKKTDLITCDAEHMKKAMIKLGAEPSKIKIINFGIDVQKFSPGLKDNELAKRIGVLNSKIVISLRNLDPIYDVETLIRATPIVLKKLPETKFLIVGSGPQERKLKKLADGFNITENIKFLGTVPNDQLPKYLRLSDVYVSTSLSDGGIAASTAEAMACGLPVIITNVGDNKKWVKDGESGFVVPTKNPQVLAEKVIYLLKNENLRKEMGKKGREIIMERNDYYKEMEKMENIYYELVEKYKTR